MIRTCDLLIRSQALYPAELRVRESEQLEYKREQEGVKLDNVSERSNPVWIGR